MITPALRAASRLADPLAAAAEIPAADAAEVVALLRRNKVPLVGLDRLPEAEAFRRALEEERAIRAALAAEVGEVVDRLAGEGIVPVLFKSAGALPYLSSNVDLLVDPSRMRDAARLLATSGHHLVPNYREENKLLFRRFRSGRHVICVHLHSAVSWGRVLVLRGEDVVARSVASQDGAFRVTAPEDLVLTVLAHALFETDQIRLSDLRSIRMASSGPGIRWDEVERRADRHGWLTGFSAIAIIAAAVERRLMGETTLPRAVESGCRERLARCPLGRRYASRVERRLADEAVEAIGAPFAISRAHSKAQAWMAILRREDLRPGEPIAEIFAIAWNLLANRFGLRCRPAAILSVSGLDGSGKSTAVGALREALVLCEVPVMVLWNRGGFTGPMRRLKGAARGALPGAVPAPGEEEAKARWLSRPIPGLLFATLVVLEQAFLWIVWARLARLAGRTVLCDRFASDTAADLEAKLGEGRPVARLAGGMIVSIAPRPDRAILLALSPQEAMRRKPGDAPGARLSASSRALERIGAQYGMTVLDAGRPEAEVLQQVVDLGLASALRRFDPSRPEESP